MAVTEQQVLEGLKTVNDPEIPVNIVDLGLIYGVKILPDDKVEVTMTLTTKGCGMSYQIAMSAKQSVLKVPGVKEATVHVVWEPAWTPDRMSEEAKKKLGVG
ncbi:MAG: aromatic ring hydroxylase [Candidatus Omnitrophica bacterium CG11_big_fil_rev_8_21_14_0_20_64_10]|nr:MAG: aromatic ring hydroxylase [Candidatus Omnitrophica bacterium CG11_big_fil_rev_8_21_14_0_20_64_10]